MKIKLLITHSIFLFIFFSLNAQSPNWIWARNTKGGSAVTNCIRADQDGTVLIAGSFSSSYLFDTLKLGGFSFPIPQGGESMLVAKYDANGNVLWVNTATSMYEAHCNSVSVDMNHNVFVTGYCTDSTIIGNTIVTGGVFIVKYDVNGNLKWVKHPIAKSYSEGYGICTDSHGNSYVTGTTESDTISFDSISLVTKNHPGAWEDLFIVKYNAEGNVVWAKRTGGNNGDNYTVGSGICTDSKDHIFITGNFQGDTVYFDSYTLANNESIATDMYIAKYDSSGNVQWVTCPYGHDVYGYKINSDTAGNVLIVGNSDCPEIIFDSIHLAVSPVFNVYNMFVVKYDSNGKALWAKSPGLNTSSSCAGYDIAGDESGNAYVIGSCNGDSIRFDSIVYAIPNGPGNHLLLVKYDQNSNLIWADITGGTSEGRGVSLNLNGDLYITGSSNSTTLNFDSIVLVNQSSGDFAFLVKASTLTGIADIGKPQPGINAFPNPFENKITIYTDKFIVDGEVNIYNMLGTKVYSQRFEGLRKTINCDIAPGIYLIQLTDSYSTFSKKIIKE